MDITPEVAARLGFPRPQYTAIERERRWLCGPVPHEQVLRTEAITDLYVTGARLRLREARPTDGGPARLRLTRKADVDAHTRLITSIYLPEHEFAVLAASLQGPRIRKLRHRLHPIDGIALIVDEFQDALAGLFLAELEFETPDELAAYPGPSFALREVTEDARYTGARLAVEGLPSELVVHSRPDTATFKT